MRDQTIQLDDQRIDQVVAFCSRLIQTHATGDVETILFGLGCLAQMAKERPREPRGSLVCKGSISLGTACLRCSKCLKEVFDRMETKEAAQS
jgi:hypothetical protein